MKTAKALIGLAFGTAAFVFLFRRLMIDWGLEMPPFLQAYCYAPAFLYGLVFWLHRPGFFRSRPVLVCLAIAWGGLVYSSAAAGGARFVVLTYLTFPPVIAAMIVEYGLWRYAARVYVWANVAAWLTTCWMELQIHHGSWRAMFARFGYLSETLLEKNANPNQIGGQFAIAAVIGFALFLYEGRRNNAAGEASPLSRWFGGRPDDETRELERILYGVRSQPSGTDSRSSGRVAWFDLTASLLLSFGCLMTASRGAAISLFAGLLLLLFCGTKTQSTARLREVVALGVVLLFAAVGTAVFFEIVPWDRLANRIFGEQGRGMTTLSGRVDIWKNAVDAIAEDPTMMAIGAGTGMADVVLGQVDGGARYSDHGVLRRFSHNTYIEWLLYYGILGAVPGIWLMIAVARRAHYWDVRDGTVLRQAILLTIFCEGITEVVFRMYSWIVPAALLLALLEGDLAFRGRDEAFAESPLREPAWSLPMDAAFSATDRGRRPSRGRAKELVS
ncbi:hypothetical protein JCM19992_12190 [Thermostilla marina]